MRFLPTEQSQSNCEEPLGARNNFENPNWTINRNNLIFEELSYENHYDNEGYFTFRYHSRSKWNWKRVVTFISFGFSYIPDNSWKRRNRGKVKGYITFTLYSRIVQIKYTKTDKVEYDVRLKIGISSETFNLFSI